MMASLKARSEFSTIPSDWEMRPLRDDILLLSGHHVMARHVNIRGVGTPYLTGPADFPNGKISQTKFTTHPSALCRPGDILVTVKGSGSGTLVRTNATYCISRQLMAIQPYEWDPTFLFYSLLQNASRIQAASTGLIPGLSRSDILDQHIPVPADSAEQRAIAEVLCDADNLIADLERLTAKKQAIKQGMMQELLTGKTRLPSFSGEWSTTRLGDMGAFLKGRGIKRDDVRRLGVPCIRYGELYTTYQNYTDETASYVSPDVASTALPLRRGDLLFAGSGETRDEIGICIAYTGMQRAVAGGDIVVLRGSVFNPIYLALLLNTPAIASQKARLGQGDAVVHISSRALASVEVELPPREEQDAIASVLMDSDTEIRLLRERLKKAKDIKQGMMQELLTGRTRLPLQEAAS